MFNSPISAENKLIMFFNASGVVAAYTLLIISLYKSTEVPLGHQGVLGHRHSAADA